MITHLIHTEDSSVHWTYFNIINQNVLDLGCGRWYTTDHNELSPIYFVNNGAKFLVGVDSNENDINYYKSTTQNDSRYEFLTENISSINQIKDLILKYNITALKCDIEGAEEVLLGLNKEDFNNIIELAIEHHSDYLKFEFLKKVVEWGFEIRAISNFVRTPDYMGVIFCYKPQ
jgi:hypothetical protein